MERVCWARERERKREREPVCGVCIEQIKEDEKCGDARFRSFSLFWESFFVPKSPVPVHSWYPPTPSRLVVRAFVCPFACPTHFHCLCLSASCHVSNVTSSIPRCSALRCSLSLYSSITILSICAIDMSCVSSRCPLTHSLSHTFFNPIIVDSFATENWQDGINEFSIFTLEIIDSCSDICTFISREDSEASQLGKFPLKFWTWLNRKTTTNNLILRTLHDLSSSAWDDQRIIT